MLLKAGTLELNVSFIIFNINVNVNVAYKKTILIRPLKKL